MSPTREVYFNISGVWVMYALLAVTLAIFGTGCYRRWRLWSLGRPAGRTDQPGVRLHLLLIEVFGHQTLLKRYRTAGFFHLLFFWGFVFLFIGTCVVFVHEDLGIPIMQGTFYLYFQSLALDIFGALAILGIVAALGHRYAYRAARLKSDKAADGIMLLLILLILVTGFVLEGLRIELTQDQWAAWSPVGRATGALFVQVMGGNTMRGLHQAAWWFHLVLVFGFIAWIPYSKLLHLFTSPANIYFQNLEPKGALPSLDMEQAETLGVSQMEQFTWKDLLDLDACTECGRCEVNCPATLTNKPLSPKALILDLRDYLHREGPVQVARKGNGADMAQDTDATSPLVGPVIRAETLWSCTTCRACMEQCPVMIEQVPKIVEMRRHLVMERAEFPDDLQGMVRSLEARGHPYPGATASRTDWLQGLELPQLAEQPDVEFEVLLWVGCAGALNERNQSVTRAVAQLLQRAGVRFAVLGREERCTGDPARRIGHEYLFTTLAQQNIATLARYNVRKILTACPHCFNTFKNEYPQLGGRYEVVHHSEFLNDLVASGRLTPTAGQFEHVTFHDPCYLGRYNDVYDAPRSVLDAIPGGKRSEPEWNRRNALCCGGGGGFAFMEETRGTRMNQNRTQQLLRTGAKTVAVGCPFCMIMVEDGVKTAAPDRAVEVLDIAEMLEHATQ